MENKLQYKIYEVVEFGILHFRLVVVVNGKLRHISTHMSAGGAATRLEDVKRAVKAA
jgi:hypothetical protein